MPNASKPSGARVIGSLRGRFHAARLKLTAIYIVILAAILFVSSGVIYSAFANQLAQRFRRFEISPNMIVTENFIPPRQQDVLNDLVFSLYIVNGLLLVIAAAASYWLAGLTLEPIQRAYDDQRRFLGDASHELRTPLAVLRIDIENRLDDSATGDDERRRLTSNLEEVDRMGRLVNDLLKLSRLDEERATERPPSSHVDLRNAVGSSVGRLQPLADERGVALDWTADDSGMVVLADEELLAQAIDNVIKNAIVYNKPQGAVVISAEKDGASAVVKVTDTGVGISEEDRPKVFDRFYRADGSRTRATGGSGLGLSIVSAAMDKLGGAVELESELGKGTTVTLKLPLA